MAALADPKLEAFAQALLRNIAAGIPKSKAAEQAGKAAGYSGSSSAANSRKRAQRKDVKARMVELAAPAQAMIEADLTVDVAAAKRSLAEIILAGRGINQAKPQDVIAAIKQLGVMEGWEAPKRTELTGKNGEPIQVTTDAERVRALQQLMARLQAGKAA